MGSISSPIDGQYPGTWWVIIARSEKHELLLPDSKIHISQVLEDGHSEWTFFLQ